MNTSLVEALDPLHATWKAVGSPTPALRWRNGAHRCARCGVVTDPTVAVTDVVSDKFTGWDDYTGSGSPLVWCAACAWGHVETDLRQYPWLVTTTGAARATPVTLAAALSRPVGEESAVVVPLSRKKHLLPSARWGRVTTDDRVLPWGEREVARLATVVRLRGLGFTETALADPIPRFEQLRTLDGRVQADVLAWWATLEPWRVDRVYLAVACRASRKEMKA